MLSGSAKKMFIISHSLVIVKNNLNFLHKKYIKYNFYVQGVSNDKEKKRKHRIGIFCFSMNQRTHQIFFKENQMPKISESTC